MAERQFLEHGFGPFYRTDSRLLILGSFPSVKSRTAQFFYGHPQNRFWAVMAGICACPLPGTEAEKRAFLAKNRIALYDVIERCSIIGSADSTIADVVPADLTPILAGSQVGTNIFVNGGKAFDLYAKYILPAIGIPAVRLPSTSPANAVWSLDRLTAAWRAELEPVLQTI